MKRLYRNALPFALFPVALLANGCGAPSGNDTSLASSGGANSAADTRSNSTTGNSTIGSATTSSTTNAAGAQKPSEAQYKVVDEAQPGLPPEVAGALQHAKVPPPPASLKAPARARVRLLTSRGPITVELDGTAAPLQVKSFLYLSRRGFYNGTHFHRFADLLAGSPDGKPGRIIQGGSPLSKDPLYSKLNKSPQTQQFIGTGGPGYQVPREYNELKHDKLVIAAARSQDLNSAGSQFYITQDPVAFLDDSGGGYTVFGKVVEGQSNALKLAQGDELKTATVLKDGAAH